MGIFQLSTLDILLLTLFLVWFARPESVAPGLQLGSAGLHGG